MSSSLPFERATTLAPANAQTKTAAFKRWFGKSKVVDSEGKPLVVYHGTWRGGIRHNPTPRTYTPPPAVAREAQMGLDLRASLPPSQRCCTAVGLRRAVQLANRQPVSVRTLKRMRSYFERHAVDARGRGWRDQSKGWQAWLCWGGDSGRLWCRKMLRILGE